MTKNYRRVVILRGVPGSRKTTFAWTLADRYKREVVDANDVVIVSTDDFWGSEYKFDVTKLAEAHNDCLLRYVKELKALRSIIVVDNTGTQRWEYEHYLAIAELHGYVVNIYEMECPDAATFRAFYKVCTHPVPFAKAAEMFARFEHDERCTQVLRPGWTEEDIRIP